MTTPNPRCEQCGKVLMVLNDQFGVCPENINSSEHSRLIPMSPELKQAIRVAELPQATLFEGIRATNLRDPINSVEPGGDKTCGVEFYSMPGRLGVWRRVSRQVKTGGQFLLAATPAGQIWQFVWCETLSYRLLEVLSQWQEDEKENP